MRYRNVLRCSALCVVVVSAIFILPGLRSLFAATPNLPPVNDLVGQSRLAHDACRQGKLHSTPNLPLVGSGDLRGGSPEQEKYDVRHYRLDLKFDRPNARLLGDVSMTADVVAPISTCELDCYFTMYVDSVKLDGSRVDFTSTWEVLYVNLGRTLQAGEKFRIQTFYHATESDLQWWSLYFDTLDNKPVIGNLSETWYARTWWPCKDHPNDKADSIDFFITYPSEQFCASNGTLISDVDNLDGFRTTHWSVRYPIATYLVSVAIAEFEHWREWAHPPLATDSLPVDFWVYPYLLADAQDTYDVTVPAIDTLSRLFGTYPFMTEKYAMSSFPWDGSAMEHQTNTSMSPYMTSQVMTVIHELAHQWWGDMITCRDWHHSWLNEGFASYAEALFVESILGKEALRNYMQGFEFFSDEAVYRYDTTQMYIILDGIVYEKGAWVLHMLRGITGDESFFNGMRAYGDSPLKYGTAVTEDFRDYMELTSGVELDWFFEEWIYGGGNPVYEYSWQCTPVSTGNFRLDLVIEQTQEGTGIFKMPIQVKYVAGSDTLLVTLWNDQGFTLYQSEFPDSVIEVALDPDNWILNVAIEKPFQLAIVSRYPPRGEVNEPYYYEMQALGGVKPYTWMFFGGDLPLGLEFTGGEEGIVSGTPTFAADYYFTIAVTDSDQPPTQRSWSFAVAIDKALFVGDCTGNGRIDIADAVFLINYIFAGGPAPSPLVLGDVDCNEMITISDAVFLVNYLYSAGPSPCH